MTLIGLYGAPGAGKDTAAGRLVITHGFRAISFAKPLYEAVAAITGLTVLELQDRRNKETPIDWIGKSPRELLQLLGTEFGRNMIHPDIWVRRAMRDAGEKCVVTDVRFDNEAEAIREAGGFVFEITRPGEAMIAAGAAAYSSEACIDRSHINATIENNGTVRDLWAAVDSVVSRLHADIM